MANLIETQVLFDTTPGPSAIKIIGYYTQATNSNTLIISANSLLHANTSKPCVISVEEIQYAAGFANGFCQLQWVGKTASSNIDLAVLGGRTCGSLICYMPNPLIADGNTANLNGGLSGDIGLTVNGGEPFDSFTLIIKVIKEGGAGGGYANGYAQYNDSWFGLTQQPA